MFNALASLANHRPWRVLAITLVGAATTRDPVVARTARHLVAT